jgi:long-chain acyl-CoA synthetase
MVENHLASSPLIAEVAVIGTSHERYVQQVTAIVVPVDGQTTADEIADWCREQPDLQGLQRPRRIEIVDKLPRMANSKVDRMALKRMFT